MSKKSKNSKVIRTLMGELDTKKIKSGEVKSKKKPEIIPPDTNKINKDFQEYRSISDKNAEFCTLPVLFEKILRLKQYELKDFLYAVLKGHGYNVVYADGYLYAKGNVPVMLCAHMDTVHDKPVSSIWMSDTGCIWSPQGIGGDDRCGIYTVLMNITEEYKPYILFTEDEEIGCIGAEKFSDNVMSGKFDRDDININYIIEIDRKGSGDSVFYECDNPEFEKYINSFGFKTARGSCSDISYVAPALGVAAVNLSCGYYQQHTLKEVVKLDELYETIKRVAEIIKDTAANDREVFEYISAYEYDNWYYYDYRRRHNSIPNEPEDDRLSDTNVTIEVAPVYLESGAYIIDGQGNMIDDYCGEYFYIDKDGRLYCDISTIDDDYMVVEMYEGAAYSAVGTLYKYCEEESILVLMKKG